MDWALVAARLCETQERPTVILDGKGTIRLYSLGLEHVLGWRRDELIGRSWLETLVAPEAALLAAQWLAEAQRGAMPRCAWPVVARGGERYTLVTTVGTIGQAGLSGQPPPVVLWIETVRLEHGAVAPGAEADLDYEIELGNDFGTVVEHSQDRTVIGKKCYQVFQGRNSRCEGCRADEGALQRTSSVVRTEPGNGYRLVTAAPGGPGRARVGSRLLAADVLAKLVQVKLDTLSTNAGLSEREREVLELLVAGRTIEDIAQALTISGRTVKYHQANVLAKLGARSRVDLLRFVF